MIQDQPVLKIDPDRVEEVKVVSLTYSGWQGPIRGQWKGFLAGENFSSHWWPRAFSSTVEWNS
jgi:hypothetical protein